MNNPSRYLEAGRALTYLGRFDDAIEHLGVERFASLDATTELAMRKMAADVELVNGRVDPYAGLLPIHAATNDAAAESRFRGMIEGRRIAIVGPAMSEIEHGAEIDDFDVVIRTKYVNHTLDGHEATAGSRTDLSYYALGSARFLAEDIRDALAGGDLQMALFRTATYDPTSTYVHRPGDVRYVPSEYQAAFRASQFAIQRIIHDVLRYRPAQVKVFNINFFLSAAQMYRPGYLAEYTKHYESQGLAQVLGSFGHDFLADFVFTQRVVAHRLVDVDERVAELLELEPADYLAGLDRRESPGSR